MSALRKSQSEALAALRSIAPASVRDVCAVLYGDSTPMLVERCRVRIAALAKLGRVTPACRGQRRPGSVRGAVPILWAVVDAPEERPAPKPHPLLPAPGRAAVLAMLSTPMTRHTIAERMGCSYDSATQYIAQLQADYKVTPCGREYSPTGRGWRMQFRAIGGAA